MDGILITERPTGISWQQISDLLKEAHAENDRQGIVSRYRISYSNRSRGMAENCSSPWMPGVLSERGL